MPLQDLIPCSPEPPLGIPSNDDIEAVIRMATAASADRSPAPLKDTRTQLFVGNVCPLPGLLLRPHSLSSFRTASAGRTSKISFEKQALFSARMSR